MTYKTMYSIYKRIYNVCIFISKQYKKYKPLIKNNLCDLKTKVISFIKNNVGRILYGISIIIIIIGIFVGMNVIRKIDKLDGKVLVEKAPYKRVQRIMVEQVDVNYTEYEYQITFLSVMGDSYFTTRLSKKDLDDLFKQTRRK